MKHIIWPFLFILSAHVVNAQNYDWFGGNWYGIKSFTGARIGIRVLVRVEVDYLDGDRFSGRFIYMYPKDTIARLMKTFSGNFHKNTINLDKSREMFLLDPRSRSFWSNCSPCSETASLELSDSAIVFKITTVNCGDSCNGETVFSRPLDTYDSSVQTTIKNLFVNDKPTVTAKTSSKQKNKNTKPVKNNAADTAKNNQPAAKVSNKQSPAVNSSSKTVASKQTSAYATADSISQRTKKQEPPGVAVIDPKQNDKPIIAEKDSLANTNKNDQSLTKLKDTATITANNGDPWSGISAEALDPAYNDSLDVKVNRETDLINAYQVDSPRIRVDLFDNGEIDYDIVSVLYNGKLIINRRTLSDTAISFTINASATNRHHELIMIAENEGSIPPNSALLRIKSGPKQFKLAVSTSRTKNAKIAIDYIGD